MQAVKNNIIISTVIGFIVSIIVMYVAYEHNAQGEIYTEGVTDFSYWMLIGLSWFIATFIVSFMVIFVFALIMKRVKRR